MSRLFDLMTIEIHDIEDWLISSGVLGECCSGE